MTLEILEPDGDLFLANWNGVPVALSEASQKLNFVWLYGLVRLPGMEAEAYELLNDPAGGYFDLALPGYVRDPELARAYLAWRRSRTTAAGWAVLAAEFGPLP